MYDSRVFIPFNLVRFTYFSVSWFDKCEENCHLLALHFHFNVPYNGVYIAELSSKAKFYIYQRQLHELISI